MKRENRPFFISLFICFVLFLVLNPVSSQAADNQSPSSESISAEEFLQSPAATLFQAGEYERALDALEPLLKQYPKDPLLIRYKAMTLDHLGRSDEAINLFEGILKENPEHIPTRYFLGQAYERNGNIDAARREWQTVTEEGRSTPYGGWAEESLKRVGAVIKPEKKAAKRIRIAGRYGYEYDSNVTLKPEDKSLTGPSDKNAGRQTLDAIFRYKAFSKRDVAVDLIYAAGQTIHDDSLDEFNFTSQEFGTDLRKRLKLAGKEVTLGTKYEFLAGFLDGNLFSIRNRVTVSADSRLTRRTRSVLFARLMPANYGPDGSNPPQTSRDGLYTDYGITQYFYSSDFKRYLYVREEYNRADVRGGNFELRGQTTRIGLFSPLIWKTELDFSTGFEFNTYPRFSSLSSLDTDRRRDMNWDLYGALTHYLHPKLGLRGFYRYINAENRNGFYEYDRHIGGIQVIFSY